MPLRTAPSSVRSLEGPGDLRSSVSTALVSQTLLTHVWTSTGYHGNSEYEPSFERASEAQEARWWQCLSLLAYVSRCGPPRGWLCTTPLQGPYPRAKAALRFHRWQNAQASEISWMPWCSTVHIWAESRTPGLCALCRAGPLREELSPRTLLLLHKSWKWPVVQDGRC